VGTQTKIQTNTQTNKQTKTEHCQTINKDLKTTRKDLYRALTTIRTRTDIHDPNKSINDQDGHHLFSTHTILHRSSSIHFLTVWVKAPHEHHAFLNLTYYFSLSITFHGQPYFSRLFSTLCPVPITSHVTRLLLFPV
jgi:hypothetical protein